MARTSGRSTQSKLTYFGDTLGYGYYGVPPADALKRPSAAA